MLQIVWFTICSNASYGDVTAILLPSLWRHFCRCIFVDRFSADLSSQLRANKRPKSFQNRCQDSLHLGLCFLSNCSTMFAPNFDPRNRTSHWFFVCVFHCFWRKRHCEVDISFWSDFCANLAPLGAQNRSNAVPRSTPACIDKSYQFLDRRLEHCSSWRRLIGNCILQKPSKVKRKMGPEAGGAQRFSDRCGHG